MKYIPLILAALRRKPVRTGVTFLSVIVAFTLFGLMIGLNATIDRMVQQAHADRIFTNSRFNTSGMPITIARQVAHLPGIKNSTVMSYLGGYVRDPKNRAGVIFFDDQYGKIFPDQVPPKQAELLRQNLTSVVMNRTEADLLHVKVGDRFTILGSGTARADGDSGWNLTVAGIFDDIPQYPGGMIAGNYSYFDMAVPVADRGKIAEVDSIVSNPAQAPALAERIDNLFANSANPTRSQTEKQAYSPNNGGGIDVEALTRKIASVGLLMILLLTANVIAQSVRERSAEFSTLKTLGFSNAKLVVLVMAEAAFPCLAGAVCGVALAGRLGSLLPDLMPPGYGIPNPTMAPQVFLWAILCAFIVILFSTALPIFRLARMDIAAALSRQT